MIDSGASHNFIADRVATLLKDKNFKFVFEIVDFFGKF